MRCLTDQETCRSTQVLPQMCRFESVRGCQSSNGWHLLFGFCPNIDACNSTHSRYAPGTSDVVDGQVRHEEPAIAR